MFNFNINKSIGLLNGNIKPFKAVKLGLDVDIKYKKIDETLFFTFDGSNSKIDWKHNFMFAKKPYKRMNEKYYVHRGFIKAYQSARDDFIFGVKQLFQEYPNIKEIVVSGHSFGGAMAILASEDLKYNYPTIKIQTITFGAPRVYSKFRFKNVQKRFDNITQFENNVDLVTTIPFKFLGYKHITKKTILNRHGCYLKQWFNVKENHMIWNYKKNLDGVKNEDS